MEHDPLSYGDNAVLGLCQARQLGQDRIVIVRHDVIGTSVGVTICTDGVVELRLNVRVWFCLLLLKL